MNIPFSKFHGAENDFLLTWGEHAPASELPELARRICARTTGVGADGWMLAWREKTGLRTKLFNSDGSEAEISGNGTRCAAAFGLIEGALSPPEMQIITAAGPKSLRLLTRSELSFLFEMDMGEPKLLELRVELHLAGKNFDATTLDVGNPQCAVFVDVLPEDWRQAAREAEGHTRFPKRSNVSFVRVIDRHTIETVFYERGAGETKSSGTGSTGAAVAGILRKVVESPVEIRTPAGALRLRWDESVYLTGPAEFICEGRYFLISETITSKPAVSNPLQQVSATEQLRERILQKKARVGVLGLGYVGLPLAVEFARAGFEVVGIDVQQSKVDEFNSGHSYVKDVSDDVFGPLVRSGKLRATSDFAVIQDLDTIDICVPTPLRKTKDPDMSFVIAASDSIAQYMHKGLLVMLESTTYPGTTDELVLPKLQTSGLTVGEDFFLCFSPERVDPGNPKFQTSNIPKVVGGITAQCTELGALFYQQALDTVVPVSSTRVAEMVKLLENTFRMINIGLVNEMALMCDRMKIDVWEVIDAAATKPFGFMPFYPGPGLGGHCIPIDPFYLSWKSKEAGIEARFIELAGYINGRMPEFVLEKIQDALNGATKPVRGSHIHVLGVAYKRNIDDVRESPALDIILLLQRRGAIVSFSDPYVNSIRISDTSLEAKDMIPSLKESDCVVIVTDHSGIDYNEVVEHSKLIVDTRNALRGFRSEKIIRL